MPGNTNQSGRGARRAGQAFSSVVDFIAQSHATGRGLDDGPRHLSKVLLPEPEGPTGPPTSPGATCMLTFFERLDCRVALAINLAQVFDANTTRFVCRVAALN